MRRMLISINLTQVHRNQTKPNKQTRKPTHFPSVLNTDNTLMRILFLPPKQLTIAVTEFWHSRNIKYHQPPTSLSPKTKTKQTKTDSESFSCSLSTSSSSFPSSKFYVYGCFVSIHVCVTLRETWVPQWLCRASDPLELEFQVVVSCHLGAGNRTWVLCKSSHLSSPSTNFLTSKTQVHFWLLLG